MSEIDDLIVAMGGYHCINNPCPHPFCNAARGMIATIERLTAERAALKAEHAACVKALAAEANATGEVFDATRSALSQPLAAAVLKGEG